MRRGEGSQKGHWREEKEATRQLQQLCMICCCMRKAHLGSRTRSTRACRWSSVQLLYRLSRTLHRRWWRLPPAGPVAARAAAFTPATTPVLGPAAGMAVDGPPPMSS